MIKWIYKRYLKIRLALFPVQVESKQEMYKLCKKYEDLFDKDISCVIMLKLPK